MTPDELVTEIFRIQNERHPDEDPGDLSIDIQDDSAAHTVWQHDYDRGNVLVGMGSSIQEALENTLQNVKANKAIYGSV